MQLIRHDEEKIVKYWFTGETTNQLTTLLIR